MDELTLREPGRWQGFWRELRIRLVVAGTDEAPHPALEATLREVVERWAQIEPTVAEYLASLDPTHHVPLEPASLGGFAARSCGFDGELTFESISVLEHDTPGRVVLTFYTGYPDGYATYRIVLVDDHPVELTAFAS